VPIFDEPFRVNGEDYTLAAKNILKTILRDYADGKEHRIFLAELRPLYNVLCGRAENEHKFGKMLSRHGMITKLIRREHTVKRGVMVNWKVSHNSWEDLVARHLTDADLNILKFAAKR
jgi:hypothetical protein